MTIETIPDELRTVAQWICWGERTRDGKPTKIPLDPDTVTAGSVTDPSTWTDFETALTATADSAVTGLGFVFTDDDPFVGIDLDHCRDADTGQPEAWAKTIVDQLDSYTEVSPSGTGYHVYVRGELPPGGNRSGNVELYESARFFTVTGDHVPGTPTEIHNRVAALWTVHAEHIADETASTEVNANTDATPTGNSLSDEDLLSRARRAKNGEKFTRLWRGDTSGYDSHSEADMAFACMLAFWTGGDHSQMDRLFRQSGLFRTKWDASHYADGTTYGEQTIQRAIVQTSDFYESQNADESATETQPPTERPSASSGVNSIDARLTNLRATIDSLDNDVARVTHELRSLRTATAASEDLVTELEQVQAQNEFLHEQLDEEQTRRKHLETRIRYVELDVIKANQTRLSRLYRLFRRALR